MIALIRKNSRYRKYLIVAFACIAAQWIVFKIFYPYPNLVFDSYAYIMAAAQNLSFNRWPIGYSKFLQLFSFISHSANLLVTLQFILLSISCLVFFFSWQILFKPGKVISYIYFFLLFCNPLFPFCCNFILSDPLFISLSVLWITQLLWVIRRPRIWMIFTHAVLLFLAFTVRYNALYFPIIGAFAFVLSPQRKWIKMAGIALPFCLVISFILYTSGQVAKQSGERQFSPFGGWKLANDALYVYEHAYRNRDNSMPIQFRALDSIVQQYFINTPDPADQKKWDYTSGSYYMFHPSSPLPQYIAYEYGNNWSYREWLKVAPLFQAYGLYLIRKHPFLYSKYFLSPNLERYFIPPGEVLGSPVPYFFNETYGGVFVRQLFRLSMITPKRSAILFSMQFLPFYSILFMIVHLCFILGLISFIFLKGLRMINQENRSSIILIICLWVCDFIFSVFSAGIVLRYQIFLIILEIAFGLFFMEFVFFNLEKHSSSDRRANFGNRLL